MNAADYVWLAIATLSLLCAAGPALLFWANLRCFRAPTHQPTSPLSCSVLIPARDEEQSISAAIESILASHDVEFELIVLDDHSRDATATIVRQFAARDPRVRLASSQPLPPGWCGKQFACWQLAQLAAREVLVFLDADVRLSPDALSRLVNSIVNTEELSLLSGFPRQVTVTFWEQLLLPLMHFILLGFLPLSRMRASRDPAFGAGCGQLMVARRDAYFATGGHSVIRQSLHDGLKLPRAFRRAGFATDVCDTTELASCRMYRTGGEVFRGLLKNAVEGLAAPKTIVPATVLLVLGQIMPLGLLIVALIGHWHWSIVVLAASGVAFGYLPRLVAVRKFKQPLLGALLHPLAIAVLLAIQWIALVRYLRGKPPTWKGRAVQAAAEVATIETP